MRMGQSTACLWLSLLGLVTCNRFQAGFHSGFNPREGRGFSGSASYQRFVDFINQVHRQHRGGGGGQAGPVQQAAPAGRYCS